MQNSSKISEKLKRSWLFWSSTGSYVLFTRGSSFQNGVSILVAVLFILPSYTSGAFSVSLDTYSWTSYYKFTLSKFNIITCTNVSRVPIRILVIQIFCIFTAVEYNQASHFTLIMHYSKSSAIFQWASLWNGVDQITLRSRNFDIQSGNDLERLANFCDKYFNSRNWISEFIEDWESLIWRVSNHRGRIFFKSSS